MLLVNSLQSGEVWKECAQKTQKSYSYINSAVLRQVYVHALLAQHLYKVFFQHMVSYSPTSETVWMQRRQKKWLKYTNFTELKKITSRIYSNCSNFSSLFSSPSNFVAVRFVSLKTVQLTVQVCCLFHFSLHSTFFQGKEKSGIFDGF